VAIVIALWVYGMPPRAAWATTGYGAAFGLFPIGWIILNVIFLYQLTVDKGLFTVLRNSLATVAPDPRVQLILIAFSFGAFIEGMAGFGAPVAISGAILIQLGFKPLQASALALIANTAPWPLDLWGFHHHPRNRSPAWIALAGFGHGRPATAFFSLLIPFWVVAAFAGFRGMWEIWPAALVAGLLLPCPVPGLKFPRSVLVDIISAVSSMGATVLLLRFLAAANTLEHGGGPRGAGGKGCGQRQPPRSNDPRVLGRAGVVALGDFNRLFVDLGDSDL